MKRIVSIILLLSVCVSALWAQSSAVSDTGSAAGSQRFSFSVEASLAAGLNRFSPRSMQVDVFAGRSFGKYLSVSAGLGVRHLYTLVTVHQAIYGYGEPDQYTYGDRFLLPLFVRLKGSVPVGRFGWAGASFVPFAHLDVGYAVDLGESAHQRTASGPFLMPAVGLDIRLQNGGAWYFATGVGIHAAQYVVEDVRQRTTSPATGNALSLNFTLGRTF